MSEDQLKQLASLGIDMGESGISYEWNHQKFIHIAPSKFGKSIFWAQDEMPYFIKLERRHGHFKHRGVECRSFDEIDTALTKLLTASKKGVFPFTSVIIDPVDRLVQRIDEDVIEWAESTFKQTFNCIGDVPNGAGWSRRTALSNGFLARFEDLPCAKVLLFHSHVEERDDRQRGKLRKATIDVGGKAGGKLLGWADHILHGEIVAVGSQSVRRIHSRGTQTMEAGTSNPAVPDVMNQKNEVSKDGTYPVIKENFQVLRRCFT